MAFKLEASGDGSVDHRAVTLVFELPGSEVVIARYDTPNDKLLAHADEAAAISLAGS